MSFELRDRDLLGRIGRLTTRSGAIETPMLLPVINPVEQVIPPKVMKNRFKCPVIITNAYIIRKRMRDIVIGKGVHSLLDYDGVIATDSGGYQVLSYGDIEVKPEEMVEFQEEIGSDIGVILDHPTGWGVSRRRAEWTVETTLQRAEKSSEAISRSQVLWVGPVQGGEFLDLVAYSARRLSALPFQLYALGSPTQVMERYRFSLLVDMIMSAKTNLPPDRAFHLFGAGHPFMFALAVALGCDLFDSAAYALYARDDRYLLPHGTKRLEELQHLPCPCPVCRANSAEDLREIPRLLRTKLLSEHNLYVSMAEIDVVKQAIREGTLWELLENRCRSHPALFSALRHLSKYREDLEKGGGAFKGQGLFYYDSTSLTRPEIVRHRHRLLEGYRPPSESDILVVLPTPSRKPFIKSLECQKVLSALERELGPQSTRVHVCVYTALFGIVPLELSETYPLSQYEAPKHLDLETVQSALDEARSYLLKGWYKAVVVYGGGDAEHNGLTSLYEFSDSVPPRMVVAARHSPWDPDSISYLVGLLRAEIESLSEP